MQDRRNQLSLRRLPMRSNGEQMTDRDSEEGQDWKTVEEETIKAALRDLATFYFDRSRERNDPEVRRGCMDECMNQSTSCACVYELVQKGKSKDENDKSKHSLVCQDIAAWCQKAEELQDSWRRGRTSKQKFTGTFRQ